MTEPKNRTASIVEHVYYVVHLYEDGKLVESRSVIDRSKYYAESVAHNWTSGVISKV